MLNVKIRVLFNKTYYQRTFRHKLSEETGKSEETLFSATC